jgi:hypothetical protein
VRAIPPAAPRADASAAGHLAELDAQYDAHVAALREHSVLAHTAVAGDSAERAEPEPPT